ncbi:hypothetical protein BROUX41_001251 [Berkeleyomyces rouxiae]|uniref:uncharacterized protein n=1 Tax=Berkeleyomyces rouxiae TaxID=2035830 RepID=UPI003B821576
MTPTDETIEAELGAAVKDLWKRNRDEITVNGVREAVENKLGLDSGFLKSPEWNRKSRDLVKTLVEKLSDEESEVGENPEESEEEPSKKPSKNNKRKASTDSEPDRKRTKKTTTKTSKSGGSSSESGSEADLSVPELSDTASGNEDAKSNAPEEHKTEKDDSGDESDMSSVVDEPPVPKRGSKAKSKSDPKPKPTRQKPSATQSADQQEIKKLQQQLGKCGVRKIWGVELKSCGGDDKAKIRHLKDMLRDCGMTGRFSDARAKEIKEQRELMADLQAVQDMTQTWGASKDGARSTRASRRAAPKSLKIEKQVIEGLSDESDEEGGDEEGDEEKPKRRGASKQVNTDDDDDGDDDDDNEDYGDDSGSDAVSSAEESDEPDAMSDESEEEAPKKKKKATASRQRKRAPVDDSDGYSD